jgi:hypothetical protein
VLSNATGLDECRKLRRGEPSKAKSAASFDGGGAPMRYAFAPRPVLFVVYCHNVAPFGDLIYAETLTRAQVITLLDEQWIG